MNDLRFAFRQLLKNPGFTAVAALTLALGIGINAGIFTILNAAAFRPLPVQGSERLIRVFQNFVGNGGPVHRNVYGDPNRVSYSEFREYRDNNRVFSGLLAYAPSVTATLGGDSPRPVSGALVSCNYFDVLKSRPSFGRGFMDSDCASPGESAVVVLSDALWRGAFDADPSLVGKAITLNRAPFIVVVIVRGPSRGTVSPYTALCLSVTKQAPWVG